MKIATVPYINSLPLLEGLSGEIKKLAPSKMAEALDSDEVDVALMPILSAIENNYQIYPECGLIGCDGRVMSVTLLIKYNIPSFDKIKSIYWDTESKTSIKLARILLKIFHKTDPDKIESVTYDNRLEADAMLLIGDKSLMVDRVGYNIWDLGKMWKNATGKGFIFACWASKRALTHDEKNQLSQAKEKGLGIRETIAQRFPSEQQELINKYMTTALVYNLSPSLQEGMELFKKYVREI